MKPFAYILLLLALLPQGLLAQTGIGKWRSHFSYSQANQVCQAEDCIYAASPLGLFHYDCSDGTTTLHDKTTDLNDVGISAIAYDPSTRCLVVAYTNANVDLIIDGHVYNLSDIKRSSISGSKSIHSIRFDSRRAYLSCGFGIVVVNIARKEIEETYYLGEGGSQAPVYDLAFCDSLIIAATPRGFLMAPKNNRLLNIVSTWSVCNPIPFFEGARLETNGNELILFDGLNSLSRLLVESANTISVVRSDWRDAGYVHPSGDRILVGNGDSLFVYDTQYHLEKTLTQTSWLTDFKANDALLAGGKIYVAHQWAGLTEVDPNSLEVNTRTPNGPGSDNAYRIVPFRNQIMVCPGGKSTTFTNAYLPPQVYIFNNERWQQADNSILPSGVYDILSIAVNPKDRHQMMATAWGSGVIEYTDSKATAFFNTANTGGALQTCVQGDYSGIRTGAVAYDIKGNAWFTNSLVDNGLVVRRKDGSWESFNTSSLTGGSEIDKIICDSVRGYKWFAGRANRIYVHDGEGKMAYVDPNNGSKLETSSVNCLVQDHHGDIWIGTNKGLKVITNGYQAFANGGNGEKSPVTCINITISNNEFAEYLMAYESITAIAVDGANRKWVGTSQGGLYLISANGYDEIAHFTSRNSPLFSDKIVCIEIQPESGEVFIGTDRGLQSYRSTATYATAFAANEVSVFPNPVRPEYDGPIAIKGFSRNALVHITDAAGHIVFSTTADGGQAVWNGRTNEGRRVASGTYFVFASDKQGKNRAVGKVLIVR